MNRINDRMMDRFYPIKRMETLLSLTNKKLEILGSRSTGKTFTAKRLILNNILKGDKFIWMFVSAKQRDGFILKNWLGNGIENYVDIDITKLTYSHNTFFYNEEVVGYTKFLPDAINLKEARDDDVKLIVVDEFNHPGVGLKNKVNRLVGKWEGTYNKAKTLLIGNTDSNMYLGIHDENSIEIIDKGVNYYSLPHNDKVHYIIDYIAFTEEEADVFYKDHEDYNNRIRNLDWRADYLGEFLGQTNLNVDRDYFNFKERIPEDIFYDNGYYFQGHYGMNRIYFIEGVPEQYFKIDKYGLQIYSLTKNQTKSNFLFNRNYRYNLWCAYQEGRIRFSNNATKERFNTLILKNN